MLKFFSSRYVFYSLILIWMGAHCIGVMYGTKNVPLHMSYVGDEQAPVNGALHILSDKSLLAVHNLPTLYYGPVFAVIAVPAVVGDAAYRFATGAIRTADQYKNFILFDWGGITVGIRIISVLAGTIGLVVVYNTLLLPEINPSRNRIYAVLGTSLLAVNYYYFEYTHFFKHWNFVLLAFLAQIYIAFRMRQTSGAIRWHWWAHGALTVLGFGISYISVIYMTAFLPLGYYLLKSGNPSVRRRLMWYVIGTTIVGLLIIWWHPYAFIRNIGQFVGIGPKAGNLNNIQNPLIVSSLSIGYYVREIMINQLPLIFAAIILIYIFIRDRIKGVWPLLWMLGSFITLTLAFFAPAVHHEGRYMLPVIVGLVVIVAATYIRYLHELERTKFIMRTVAGLLAAYAIFHLIYDVRWMYIFNKGPIERQLIEQVLTMQETGTPIAVVNSYILGYPHTKESYAAFMQKGNRKDLNLYKAIMNSTLPNSVPLLDVRYIDRTEFENDPHVLATYPHVIVRYYPRPEELNQFDYMDENLFRLWWWDDFAPTYYVLK